MHRLILALVAALVACLAHASPAAADCSGPTTTFEPHDVDRGATVTVIGSYWGTNCYDTGPPPDGEGVLGRPVQDIQIVVVQGAQEWIVATVDAEDDYDFETQVSVPADAAPGDAQLIARADGPLYVMNVDPALRISPAPAVTTPPPSTTEEATGIEASAGWAADADPSSERLWDAAPWLALVLALAGLAAAGLVVVRRRSTG